MKSFARFLLVSALVPAFFTLLLTGCSKDSPVDPTPTSGISAGSDAAESVAGAIGEQSGGMMDQVGDVIDLTRSITLGKASADDFIDQREATYDEATGTWTLVLQRERGVPGQVPYGYWERTFTFQFLNATGQPQKLYVTAGDTARTINFNIVDGDGYHKNRRVAHDLKELQGAFIVTDANKPMVTVNGTYHRAAVDTISTKNFTRTSDHVLDLTLTDLVGPRNSRRDLEQKVSGTISGTFHADIVFDGKRGYAEKTVDEEIYIVINNGQADIQVNGENYTGDLETGQIE